MSKINFAMFLAGATVGAAGAWFYCKRYYEQIAQEEIDSVKAAFAERKPDALKNAKKDFEEGSNESNKQKADMAKLKPDLVNYAAKLQEQGYTNYSNIGEQNDIKKKDEEDETVVDGPYVIPPEEYGVGSYTTISLTYYSDGILADDEDERVENIEDTVGADFAEHFGDYEEDSVHIRNDRRRCDYEICRDNRTFAAVAGVYPDDDTED